MSWRAISARPYLRPIRVLAETAVLLHLRLIVANISAEEVLNFLNLLKRKVLYQRHASAEDVPWAVPVVVGIVRRPRAGPHT